VLPLSQAAQVSVGYELLGRVIDGAGYPLDGDPLPTMSYSVPLNGRRINPLNRDPIRQSLDVGVRAINSLLTVGRGQRLGLFAGTGVGKSILLGMMAKYTQADIVVVGLVGERGREVNEFIRQILGPEGLARSVVVAAPADDPPLRRLHGALRATAIAEFFRDQGLNVLLLMDSLTRYAQAQREIALAVGEPPASKGYPPSVFARLPQLIERAGNGEPGKGSITAFYTVLTEGDDNNDPVADSARGVLDGHFVLSRRIAESGRYPAIDIEASISRVMQEVVSREQMDMALRVKRIMSLYQQNQDLISVGAYARGSNPQIDEAIRLQPALTQFLSQKPHESVGMEQSLRDMITLFSA
jgi:flagellum-specific ATP synthase